MGSSSLSSSLSDPKRFLLDNLDLLCFDEDRLGSLDRVD